MKKKPPEKFEEKEVDQLIEAYGKKPSKGVREKLSKTLSNERKRFLEKDRSKENPKSREKEL